jgi:surfeit locus 1 family protein
LLGLLAFAAFMALGVWQVQRRAWKLDLIEQVEARVHAPAVAAPGPASWAALTDAQDAYRHVRATGAFEAGDTLVQAVTDRGGGFWVMTPLRTDRNFVVLVNRGFVPANRRDPADRADAKASGETTVTGLLRMPEPTGAFLRRNDPLADRWYSRDVAAIAQARGLGEVAPYFIDADADLSRGGLPIGGLTVVAFPNNHLAYAITWFALALLVAGGSVHALRGDAKGRSDGRRDGGRSLDTTRTRSN